MIHYQDDTVTIHHGDVVTVMRSDELGYDYTFGYGSGLPLLPDNSIDAVVTDPPYGLEFMGKDWDAPWKTGNGFRRAANAADAERDNVFGRQSKRGPEYIAGVGFQQWCTTWATELLRVLKPGGHILAFGGTRTWHRLAAAIEDAGFEIRDSMAWLYGSGFPKSLDVSKAIDKAAGAEREVISEGAPVKRMIPGADQKRTGSWIKDNGREFVPTKTVPATTAAKQWAGWGTALKPSFEPIIVGRKPFRGNVASNVLAHGTGAINIDDCRVGSGGQLKWDTPRDMGYHGGTNSAGKATANDSGRWPANVLLDESQAAELDRQSGIQKSGVAVQRNGGGQRIFNQGTGITRDDAGYGDTGGASRFFPTFRYTAKASSAERPKLDGQGHPTVKPLELMRWLVRLVTPPDGTVLEPFAGSGTTVEACLREGKRCIAIERDDTYLQLIVNRIDQTQLGFDIGA